MIPVKQNIDITLSRVACRVELYQGRLTINNTYTQREFKIKFSALLKGDDLKYTENSNK